MFAFLNFVQFDELVEEMFALINFAQFAEFNEFVEEMFVILNFVQLESSVDLVCGHVCTPQLCKVR